MFIALPFVEAQSPHPAIESSGLICRLIEHATGNCVPVGAQQPVSCQSRRHRSERPFSAAASDFPPESPCEARGHPKPRVSAYISAVNECDIVETTYAMVWSL